MTSNIGHPCDAGPSNAYVADGLTFVHPDAVAPAPRDVPAFTEGTSPEAYIQNPKSGAAICKRQTRKA